MTTGDAFRKAVELLASLGEEAVHVAGENMDKCTAAGDGDGVQFWLKVSEFIGFLANSIQ